MNNDVSNDTMLQLQRPMYLRVCKIDLIDEPLSIFDEAKRIAKWHEFARAHAYAIFTVFVFELYIGWKYC